MAEETEEKLSKSVLFTKRATFKLSLKDEQKQEYYTTYFVLADADIGCFIFTVGYNSPKLKKDTFSVLRTDLSQTRSDALKRYISEHVDTLEFLSGDKSYIDIITAEVFLNRLQQNEQSNTSN